MTFPLVFKNGSGEERTVLIDPQNPVFCERKGIGNVFPQRPEQYFNPGLSKSLSADGRGYMAHPTHKLT